MTDFFEKIIGKKVERGVTVYQEEKVENVKPDPVYSYAAKDGWFVRAYRESDYCRWMGIRPHRGDEQRLRISVQPAVDREGREGVVPQEGFLDDLYTEDPETWISQLTFRHGYPREG